MTKAEQRALEAYPVTMVRRRYDGIARSDDPYDSNLHDRYCFQKGYEQAEEDLALTWEDVKEIVRIADGMMYSADSLADIEKRLGIQPYYTEVLTRFKQYKEERNESSNS